MVQHVSQIKKFLFPSHQCYRFKNPTHMFSNDML